MTATGGLLLVGSGKMGGAMLEGWLEQGLRPEELAVVEPFEGNRPKVAGARIVGTGGELASDFRPQTVVLAVKPQSMDQALPPLQRFADSGAVFLSIAAGKTLGYFYARLGNGAKLVRSMPNTPAAVRQGTTVAVAGPGVSVDERARCDHLLAAVGSVLWVDDERLLDPVTAVSGSGPAYVFLLVEALAKAGVAAGLPPDMAMALARGTVAGSGELLRRSPEAASQLRVNVTSPGGTTAAALGVLMADDGLQPLLTRAVDAATRRSRELAG